MRIRNSGPARRACRRAGIAAIAMGCLPLVSCADRVDARNTQAATTPAAARPDTPGTATTGTDGDVRPLDNRIPADLLVQSTEPLPRALRRRVADTAGVRTTLAFALGQSTLNGHEVRVAAVDPSTFRAYAPPDTADSDPLWASVARGELAVAHSVAEARHLDLGGTAELAGEERRVGAFATTLPGVDVVVAAESADAVGLDADTGLVVSVRRADPAAVGQRLTRVVGKRAHVELLSAPDAVPRAFRTGAAAAKAFGSFSYRYFADGTIAPDPAWVDANIRTERVPILGKVTCHRLMLPQLRGALRDLVRAGLTDTIHPAQYGGCYVPRFIESDPNRPISLHTWGIAIDLNVAGNQRGTRGEMSRRVVAIFKKWGFAWGGDWQYTDPMHFELAALLEPAQRPR